MFRFLLSQENCIYGIVWLGFVLCWVLGSFSFYWLLVFVWLFHWKGQIGMGAAGDAPPRSSGELVLGLMSSWGKTFLPEVPQWETPHCARGAACGTGISALVSASQKKRKALGTGWAQRGEPAWRAEKRLDELVGLWQLLGDPPFFPPSKGAAQRGQTIISGFSSFLVA